MTVLAVVTAAGAGELASAAKQLGNEVDLCLPGGEKEQVKALACLDGVRKVIHINPGDRLDSAEALCQGLRELAEEYKHVIALADSHGKNFMPRLAAITSRAMVGDVIAIDSETELQRPIYAGNAIAHIKAEGRLCITVRATQFDAAPTHNNTHALTEERHVKITTQTRVIEKRQSTTDRAQLTKADRVVCGGRGLQSKKQFWQVLEPLADALGAAIGASRAAVDDEYISNDYQVGQSGKVVAPDLYIAVGISGAVQHLAGMMQSRVIVAINKDASAPVFQIADYGLVGDLFELVPELTRELRQR